MGWANCGTDSKGRPIGYAHEATCDHPGCDAKIDRGLSYACGGMHGEDVIHGTGYSCEGYFCPEHLGMAYGPDGDSGPQDSYCPACVKEIEAELAEEASAQPEEKPDGD